MILAAVILLGCSACEPGDTPKREAQELQGIVLILLDTVRADHVGCYGYDRPTTPNMDALAKRGVRFDQVIAPSPWTLPSVAALLSAQHPAREFASTRKITTSVVEDFQRAGFETGGVTEGGYVSDEFGFDRGFGYWVEEQGAVQLLNSEQRRDPNPRGSIENTFALARKWLVKHKRDRFFLFIHTYEVHTPYRRRDFAKNLDAGSVGPTLEIAQLRALRSGQVVLNESETEYVKALYDGGVLHADRHVGSFLSFLKTIGLSENTLIVVTSDHGEELGDHYPRITADHGHSLHDALLRVPLILYHPKRKFTGGDVMSQVRLIDLMPTIAELAGVSIDRPMDGKSMVPLLIGEDSTDRVAVSGHTKRGPPRMSIRDQGFKLIRVTGNDASTPPLTPVPTEIQLYDLTEDPSERTNLAESRPQLVAALTDALQRIWSGLGEGGELTPPDVVDPQLLERLKSLGYIGD